VLAGASTVSGRQLRAAEAASLVTTRKLMERVATAVAVAMRWVVRIENSLIGEA
jgi:hypothetical protein